MIYTRGAGCYGINGADTVTYDAAVLSQAVGKPVRVQLSRKDEMAWENYGNLFAIDQRVGSRRERHDRRVGLRGVVARPKAAGPATTRPATSSPGTLLGLQPGAVQPAHAGAGADDAAQQQLQHRAVVHRRPRAATRRTAPASCAASACCHTASGRRSSPARCARPSGCRTRSRTSASWTRSRRT